MASMEKNTITTPATAINIDQLRFMCASVGRELAYDTVPVVRLRCSFTLRPIVGSRCSKNRVLRRKRRPLGCAVGSGRTPAFLF